MQKTRRRIDGWLFSVNRRKGSAKGGVSSEKEIHNSFYSVPAPAIRVPSFFPASPPLLTSEASLKNHFVLAHVNQGPRHTSWVSTPLELPVFGRQGSISAYQHTCRPAQPRPVSRGRKHLGSRILPLGNKLQEALDAQLHTA